ncbi:MAG: pirin family protein, partial [Betaproteobacteria bacterium]|nr:pirin family protein [Betaproteobacteria bacterium]
MMMLRRSEERGHANHGWLDTFHTFSFADYHDPAEMGFGALRVINDDRVAPGTGFGTHGHRDMEIITYILDGALEHKDSMGNGSVIRPGDVQRMSAGRGVRHSEFNPSRGQGVRLLQIWIEPALKGIDPGYEQKHFPADERRGRLKLIASRDGRHNSVSIHQDALVYAGLLDGDDRVEHALAPGRRAYVHVARGSLEVNGVALEGGDGLKVFGESVLELARATNAEVL